MDFNETVNILEAVLFASGDSVSKKKLTEVLGTDMETLERAIDTLADFYDYNRRGIKLLKLEDSCQLCSRGEYSQYVREVLELRKPNPLSKSALEVLAIVAYKQPVTKVYIEQVRGVDSAYTVRSLVEKELIESCGRLDVPGKPALYRTTENFLRTFGISHLSQLPDIKEFPREGDEQLSFGVLDKGEDEQWE